jgi:glucose/arabinose dehydrogenase
MGPCLFLDGPQWKGWEGRLAVGFLRGERIVLLALDGAGRAVGSEVVRGLPEERIRSLVAGPDGSLVVATDGGEIWRLTPTP